MSDDTSEAPVPALALDTTDQFARRIQTSGRTVTRLIKKGMKGVVRIGDLVRIDAPVALASLPDLSKPRAPRGRGRPRKSDQ